MHAGAAPAVTGSTIYNENGALMFNGQPIGSGGGGGGPSFFVEQTDKKIYTTGSVAIGIATGSMTSLDVFHDYATTTFENQLADGQGGGDVLKYGTGTTVAGKLYYLHTTAAWTEINAGAAATGASQILGVALGTSPTTNGILLRGFVRIASSLINGTPAIGSPLYASTTAGEYTFTKPSSSNNFVRIVGYCLDTHTSDVFLYFNPDSTWVEIS